MMGPGRALMLFAVLALGGCESDGGRLLRAGRIIELESEEATTLAVDSSGRFWLGFDGGMVVRDTVGASTRIDLPGAGSVAVVGRVEAGVLLRLDSMLILVHPDSGGSVRAERPGVGHNPLLVDVRGRNLLEGARSGAVLAYDPANLEPISAWSALGLASTALAESPAGDRIYQALSDGEGVHRILIRDTQTGRILGSEQFSATVAVLVGADDESLYGVLRFGRRLDVIALRPEEHRLDVRWRRSIEAAVDDPEVRVAVAAGRVVVWGLGPGRGLQLLDATDGTPIGRTEDAPLDVAFGPRGELWELRPGSVRRLQ